MSRGISPFRAFLIAIPLVCLMPATALPANDVTMRGGLTSVTRKFELIDNRIFLDVMINGRGPFKFILDSGAGNLLTLETARKLNLPLESTGLQSGAGAGRIESWTTKVDSLSIGELKMRHQTCTVMSLDPIVRAIGFEHIDGLVGYELFRKLEVELDYDSATVTFRGKDGFSAPENYDEIPFELRGHTPVVEAMVDGLGGRFIVDTGDRSSLTLFAPFVEDHNLAERYRLTPEITTGWGIGGPVPARVTRVDSVRVHQSTVSGVVTRLSTLRKGAFSASDVAGSIGTGVLRRFSMIFDYPGHRLFLKPNAAANRPDPWDGAGLWLVQGDGGFEVHDVLPGSPAEQAGIQVGDVITSVNGRDPAIQPLLAVRRVLSDDHEGATVRLTLQGHPDARSVDLVLRKIL